MHNIGSFILQATLLLSSPCEREDGVREDKEGVGGERRGGESRAGVSLAGVAGLLLGSEAFQEMRALHEATLGVCFAHAASTLPKG